MKDTIRLIRRLPEFMLMIVMIILSFAPLALWIIITIIMQVILWLCGFPIWVKERGEKVGYYRWFKYHRK